jgi:hypothetical protein
MTRKPVPHGRRFGSLGSAMNWADDPAPAHPTMTEEIREKVARIIVDTACHDHPILRAEAVWSNNFSRLRAEAFKAADAILAPSPPVDGGRGEVGSDANAKAIDNASQAGGLAPVTVAAVLRAAADLIEPEGKWTKGALGRDANGHWTRDIDRAVCLCVVGAIRKAAGCESLLSTSPLATAARRHLERLVTKETASSWNDRQRRKQSAVVAALRQAAALADGPLEGHDPSLAGNNGLSNPSVFVPGDKKEGADANAHSPTADGDSLPTNKSATVRQAPECS